mmetsp:Transcript_1451/g.1917  ORF Transcript_1451/g.1917 Transcript_1451/m.1917 type:complete len:248 (+) Transcript_1451:60-803(+)|eukprot:CAMPEP_0168558528 /NCGR_PEP_ID=MMETSP0413-20121227/10021_1 /TAXON_ID=136452 /ORGANISM="Filamoeba nolandi, Strain NC-AS-23-1" /LENGTH=247 /DNA_ID=CAMNT_0008589661 /DNA_START=39 /DNA_END=782 /DNA_ORIENTATION=+
MGAYESVEEQVNIYEPDFSRRGKEKFVSIGIFTCFIEKTPFSDGAMRNAYRGTIKEYPNRKFVFKSYKDQNISTNNALVKQDASMQLTCRIFAEEWNDLGMPKPVNMLHCRVGRLSNGTLMSIEPYLEGEYQKHNNNAGYVGQRNTPQTFSHYTFERTNGELLVCDLQGVGDYYTDPQIHTRDGRGYGAGNRGWKGIEDFFVTHECNNLCACLKLPDYHLIAQSQVQRSLSSDYSSRMQEIEDSLDE